MYYPFFSAKLNDFDNRTVHYSIKSIKINQITTGSMLDFYPENISNLSTAYQFNVTPTINNGVVKIEHDSTAGTWDYGWFSNEYTTKGVIASRLGAEILFHGLQPENEEFISLFTDDYSFEIGRYGLYNVDTKIRAMDDYDSTVLLGDTVISTASYQGIEVLPNGNLEYFYIKDAKRIVAATATGVPGMRYKIWYGGYSTNSQPVYIWDLNNTRQAISQGNYLNESSNQIFATPIGLTGVKLEKADSTDQDQGKNRSLWWSKQKQKKV